MFIAFLFDYLNIMFLTLLDYLDVFCRLFVIVLLLLYFWPIS